MKYNCIVIIQDLLAIQECEKMIESTVIYIIEIKSIINFLVNACFCEYLLKCETLIVWAEFSNLFKSKVVNILMILHVCYKLKVIEEKRLARNKD